jgi:hypothetical protein
MSEVWMHPGLKAKSAEVNLLIHPAFKLAAPILHTAWKMHGAECVVTSGRDGKHSENSAHYVGRAVDLRTWNIPGDVQAFASNLSKALVSWMGREWYVVLEESHIHLEFSMTTPNIKGWVKGKNLYVQK